jgi:hypothetical protein
MSERHKNTVVRLSPLKASHSFDRRYVNDTKNKRQRFMGEMDVCATATLPRRVSRDCRAECSSPGAGASRLEFKGGRNGTGWAQKMTCETENAVNSNGYAGGALVCLSGVLEAAGVEVGVE